MTAHYTLAVLIGFLLLLIGLATFVWTPKPGYHQMAEKTIIVRTGTTECHYVPDWEAISCVTLPPVYGPVAPATLP
jgi:hypothetical protein